MQRQYLNCTCDHCQSVVDTIQELHLQSENSNNKTKFKSVFNAAEIAFQHLFSKKNYKPEHLFTTPEYKALIEETTKVFSAAISHRVSDSMRAYLERDAFVFSGLKTHAQLAEARAYLKDSKGNITPYHLFEQKVTQLNKAYNKNYLEAEYEFAVHSAQSVERWESFSDDENRYYLQYRTAGDNKVREEHQSLNEITLPKSNPFWSQYYPPNGWRCRCVAVQVLARKNTPSDSAEAIKKGKVATTQIGKNGKNKLEMFRFNPGKQKKLFPPKNSYTPKHCNGEKLNLTGLIGYSDIILSLESERCKAKKLIEEKAKAIQKEKRKVKDKELNQWRKEHIPADTGLLITGKQFKYKEVVINRKGVKNVYSHFTETHLKDLVKDIEQIAKKGQFKKEVPIDPNSHNYTAKVKAGFESYRYYLSQHKGYNIRINTAVVDGVEKIYSLNIVQK